MTKTLINALRLFICAVFTMQLMGCGTLMHPERKGQRDGRIDVGVALLDGIGLFFFLIPGVIAFAVDFSNGTIYLPGGILRSSLDMKNIKEVKFDPKHTSLASLERIIKDQTGREVKLDQENIKVAKLRSVNDMLVQLAQANFVISNDRIALLERSNEHVE